MRLDPALIAPVHDGTPPPFVLEVPLKSVAQARLESHLRPVPELMLDFAAIDRVTTIVSRAVLHELNEARARAATRSRAAGKPRPEIPFRPEGLVRHRA